MHSRARIPPVGRYRLIWKTVLRMLSRAGLPRISRRGPLTAPSPPTVIKSMNCSPGSLAG